MEQATKILKECGYGNLATIEDGKPRVRPFGFMFEEGGKYYLCTASNKDVYKQLVSIPYVEYSATTKEMLTVRIRGSIKFTEDMNMKEKALESSDLVKLIYKTADNPIFKVFYIEPEEIIIATLDGEPPKIYKF